jgi:hypothetical protein
MFFFTNNRDYTIHACLHHQSFPILTSSFVTAICAKLVLVNSIYFWGIVIVSNLEPLCGFQAQSIVHMFIKTGLYVKSIVHFNLFLVSQPK